ncbi:MAG: hypothetical protein QOD95_266, partial [Gammaproteobacteria bacterium]|nr:hypothetical protein [Gammaproteobacteria bacterium]
MGNGDRRFGVLGVGERYGGMVLGLQRRQSRPAVFLRLQVRLCSRTRRLR